LKIGDIIKSSPIKEEPLQKHQWYIKNTGQRAFAVFGGLPGADLNMAQTIRDNITGRGVVVGIVDNGADVNHPDLKDNINLSKSCSFDMSDSKNPICRSDNIFPKSDHGTSVAGIIGASINNSGIRGISPNVELRIFNPIHIDYKGYDILKVLSLGAADYSKDVDIFNQSHSNVYPHNPPSDELITRQYIKGGTSGRDGKGQIYVMSAGNDFNNHSLYGRAVGGCPKADIYKLTCTNSNFTYVEPLPYHFFVSALNAKDSKATYSSGDQIYGLVHMEAKMG